MVDRWPAPIEVRVGGDGRSPVLGRATASGYVLIGVKSVGEVLFAGVERSSDRVLARTFVRCAGPGWRWQELAGLADIYQAVALALLAGVKGSSRPPNSLISK